MLWINLIVWTLFFFSCSLFRLFCCCGCCWFCALSLAHSFSRKKNLSIKDVDEYGKIVWHLRVHNDSCIVTYAISYLHTPNCYKYNKRMLCFALLILTSMHVAPWFLPHLYVWYVRVRSLDSDFTGFLYTLGLVHQRTFLCIHSVVNIL